MLTLISIVILKMEVRRKGYALLQQSHNYKKQQEQYYFKSLQYAKLTRPERVRKLALSRLTFGEAREGQIIQMSENNIFVK